MSKMYEIAMKSVIGTREEQQDSAFYKVDGQGVIAIVCDGMGGLSGGAIASTATVEMLKKLYENKDIDESLPEFLLKSVDILDEHIFHLKNGDGKKLDAGTTLVAAVIEKGNLHWLSVGDSRLYILRGSEFVQVTRDHNYFAKLEQMIKEKEISPMQYRTEAIKGEALTSFIGVGGIELMDINNSPFQLLHGDIILLSSDGLYKALINEEIVRHLQLPNIEESVSTLISKASEASKKFQDNTTCIVIKYISQGAIANEVNKMQ